jgi:hypothetical protein
MPLRILKHLRGGTGQAGQSRMYDTGMRAGVRRLNKTKIEAHLALRKAKLLLTLGGLLCLGMARLCEGQRGDGPMGPEPAGGENFTLDVGGAHLQLEVTGATPDLPVSALVEHFREAAQAVSSYYGRFPVPTARIRIMIAPDRAGILQGTTWGDVGGFPAVTRFRIGQHTTALQLKEDWMATHELVHMALPSLGDDQHWLEEGLSTYVEPIARAQLGQLTLEDTWDGMLDGMPKGEPGNGDQGLDRTHTWGRTYWGGALFCMVAEVEIRKRTGNVHGLQDALRGIVASGGAINHEWPIEKTLAAGDAATGTTVLEDMYKSWSTAPVTVDLPSLWKQLGVSHSGNKVVFDDAAPLAEMRKSMTTPRNQAAHRDKK